MRGAIKPETIRVVVDIIVQLLVDTLPLESKNKTFHINPPYYQKSLICIGGLLFNWFDINFHSLRYSSLSKIPQPNLRLHCKQCKNSLAQLNLGA